MAYIVYRCLEESFGKYLLKSKWILRNRRQTCKQLERLWVTTQKWQNATFPLKGEIAYPGDLPVISQWKMHHLHY